MPGPVIGVSYLNPDDQRECPTSGESLAVQARKLATELHLPFLESPELPESQVGLVLRVTPSGLDLTLVDKSGSETIQTDFQHPALNYRLQDRVGSQAIARSIGNKPGLHPDVLDATAGLGKDAFLMASLGCQVQLLERNPIVHALLRDGLTRALESTADRVRQIAARMQLAGISLADFATRGLTYDVVYLDPMFPARRKSARVKKDLYVLQHLLRGETQDEVAMLEDALRLARRRVVVKRPLRAAPLAQRQPSFSLEGRVSRFDVFVNA